MRDTTTIRDRLMFDDGDAATLQRIDESRFQAQCELCHRSSPVVGGDLEDALLRIANLGWTTTTQSTWTCPLCEDRDSGRYTIPAPK